MDDKSKVLKLYEKMNNIRIKTNSLIDSIEKLEADLDKYLVINNKAFQSKEITNQKNQIKEIKKSVKYDVMSNLRHYL